MYFQFKHCIKKSKENKQELKSVIKLKLKDKTKDAE
jgi:hypothetical protein